MTMTINHCQRLRFYRRYEVLINGDIDLVRDLWPMNEFRERNFNASYPFYIASPVALFHVPDSLHEQLKVGMFVLTKLENGRTVAIIF